MTYFKPKKGRAPVVTPSPEWTGGDVRRVLLEPVPDDDGVPLMLGPEYVQDPITTKPGDRIVGFWYPATDRASTRTSCRSTARACGCLSHPGARASSAARVRPGARS